MAMWSLLPYVPTAPGTAGTSGDHGALLGWTPTRHFKLYPAQIVGAMWLEKVTGPLAQAGHLEQQLGGAQLIAKVDDVWKKWWEVCGLLAW